ncbi:tRNA threonylcarbamoyladenosine biosynthesis protein TsaE [Spiroplasma helicoides]|uniref:tRNA threonylcarbamoyladenosine biosynthesis protein TsaE n=1 Tax=Spiroplasma helicoides TaxID=216938 RepID=A0A1B3SJL1_9MOLU|nr:tRNA (adenosine(37)-N6)-threonylcarbamoyltransferase complex ATPase subunit type 1 TsaE [Spiroplasma helicoides]AOG60119.1 tRNA threonylcarbamoyladenosine biosynthesis protein TsaE [Spiroplasma helicoides]
MIINSMDELSKVVDIIKPYCQKNMVILLNGDLGAGKTTFTKKLLKQLGVKELVNSPTFVIMNQYEIKDFKINHVDAYRLNKDEEVELYLEHFYESLNIIEWSENLNIDYGLYFKIIKINIKIIDENKREFIIEGIE